VKAYSEEAGSEPPPMRAARAAAKKSKQRFKLGAAIARGNKVLCKAPNDHKTHPIYGSGLFCTLHAESNAIYTAVRQGINLKGTIYVYRVNNNLAKPCPCCMALIKKMGIQKVVFSHPQKVKDSIIVHGR
jgi:deoxycytidylate deaminase